MILHGCRGLCCDDGRCLICGLGEPHSDALSRFAARLDKHGGRDGCRRMPRHRGSDEPPRFVSSSLMDRH